MGSSQRKLAAQAVLEGLIGRAPDVVAKKNRLPRKVKKDMKKFFSQVTKTVNEELLENIVVLMARKGVTPAEVSIACRHPRSWLKKILLRQRRMRPDNYAEVAAYFQLQPWQLLQPGIVGLHERRQCPDRRVSGGDRRQSPAARAAMLASRLNSPDQDP